MEEETADHFSGRSKFAHYRFRHLEDAAKLLFPQGFTSWGTLSKIDEETGKFLREDLRKAGTTAIKLSLVDEILPHIEQEKPSKFPDGVFKNDKKEPKIEEIVTPTQMRRWAASLSDFPAFFAPDQETANVFTKGITIAQKKDPPYTPLVLPKPHELPWCVDLPSHERANKAWRDSAPRKTKDSPQQVSFQVWALYLLWFILVGIYWMPGQSLAVCPPN